MVTGISLQGTNLRTLGYDLETASGWDSFPGLKVPVAQNGYRHGYRLDNADSRWVYRDRDLFLALTVLPVDPTTGQITSSALEHVEENMDAIMGLLHSNDGSPLQLVKTMPSALVKTAECYPVEGFPWVAGDGVSRRVTLGLNMPYPFWHAPISNNAGLSGAFQLNNTGNAPVNDMVITFNAAATLTNNDNGDEIVCTSGGVTLDVGTGVITGGDDTDLSFNVPWLFELRKGINNLNSTGSVDINFNPGYLT